MVSNAAFNSFSVISWLSVLLVEETGVPGENNRPGFERRSDQTKDQHGICKSSVKHSTFRSNGKNWLVLNQDVCPSAVTCLPANCCFSELAL
jgi:hypothetical protein